MTTEQTKKREEFRRTIGKARAHLRVYKDVMDAMGDPSNKALSDCLAEARNLKLPFDFELYAAEARRLLVGFLGWADCSEPQLSKRTREHLDEMLKHALDVSHLVPRSGSPVGYAPGLSGHWYSLMASIVGTERFLKECEDFVSPPPRAAQADSDENTADDQDAKTASKDGRTVAERELVIGEFLKPHVEDLVHAKRCRKTIRKATIKDVEADTGASHRAVAHSKTWRRYNRAWEAKFGKSRTSKGKGRRPSAVSLNEEFDEHSSSEDEKLQKLIEDQARDSRSYSLRSYERL